MIKSRQQKSETLILDEKIVIAKNLLCWFASICAMTVVDDSFLKIIRTNSIDLLETLSLSDFNVIARIDYNLSQCDVEAYIRNSNDSVDVLKISFPVQC